MNTQSPEGAWEIRGYRPGDEDMLVELFGRVFQRPMTPAYWRWKLKGLPSPVQNVWMAVSDEKPIFQYGGIPASFHLPGGKETVMISVDTITAPEFRRRGLLTSVGQYTYDTWRKAGIPFIIGLPNEQWGSRADALGWEPLFQLQWLVYPLAPETILAQRMKLPVSALLSPLGSLWRWMWGKRLRPDATVTIRHVTEAKGEFDRLWEACRPDWKASLHRDGQWVHWRYLEVPGGDYRVLLAERGEQPVGYIVYRLEEREGKKIGVIADMLTQRSDKAASHTLIHHALRHLKEEGAESALTLAVPDSWPYSVFRQAGFFVRQHSFSVKIVPLDEDLPMHILRDPGAWMMAGGDFDVV